MVSFKQIDYLNLWTQVDLNVKTMLAYCYFLFTGIKYCVAVKEMYNSNPAWTPVVVQGFNNQCERREETQECINILYINIALPQTHNCRTWTHVRSQLPNPYRCYRIRFSPRSSLASHPTTRTQTSSLPIVDLWINWTTLTSSDSSALKYLSLPSLTTFLLKQCLTSSDCDGNNALRTYFATKRCLNQYICEQRNSWPLH